MFSYVALVICFPRVFSGLHYPTDIIAGAFIGIVLAHLANTSLVRTYMAQPVLRWENQQPSIFYACFFFFSYQMATLFNDIRNISRMVNRIFL